MVGSYWLMGWLMIGFTTFILSLKPPTMPHSMHCWDYFSILTCFKSPTKFANNTETTSSEGCVSKLKITFLWLCLKMGTCHHFFCPYIETAKVHTGTPVYQRVDPKNRRFWSVQWCWDQWKHQFGSWFSSEKKSVAAVLFAKLGTIQSFPPKREPTAGW